MQQLNLFTSQKRVQWDETRKLCMLRVEFDGGTSCNDPRKGYGIGYGSFKVGSDPIVRCDHVRPMSATAAECWTAVEAIRYVLTRWLPERTSLEIHGDSQNALARCERPIKSKKVRENRESEYTQSGAELLALCQRFHSVRTLWRGRIVSVKLFGH